MRASRVIQILSPAWAANPRIAYSSTRFGKVYPHSLLPGSCVTVPASNQTRGRRDGFVTVSLVILCQGFPCLCSGAIALVLTLIR